MRDGELKLADEPVPVIRRRIASVRRGNFLITTIENECCGMPGTEQLLGAIQKRHEKTMDALRVMSAEQLLDILLK